MDYKYITNGEADTKMTQLRELQTKFDEDLAKQQPDYFYDGAVPADNDELDYVKLNLKGVRLG